MTTPTPPPADRADWQRARDHCEWITPTIARKLVLGMLDRGQAAEQERDALWAFVRVVMNLPLNGSRLIDDNLWCNLGPVWEAWKHVPEPMRARLAQEG